MKFTKQQYAYLKDILTQEGVSLRATSYGNDGCEIQVANEYKTQLDGCCVNKYYNGEPYSTTYTTERLIEIREEAREATERFAKT